MRAKKTGLWIFIAGLLMLGACVDKPSDITPGTVTLSPTKQITAAELPDITKSPTVTPSPVVTPTPMATATSTPVPSSTPTMTPTATPILTATPTAPTIPTVIPLPTATPILTTTPSPTATPLPTATATPSPSPTSMVNPESLVHNGWQKTVDISGTYDIVFPENFDESSVIRGERELITVYTDTKDVAVEFSIQYTMKQTLEEAREEATENGAVILSQAFEERRFSYQWEDDILLYQGVVLECQYPKELLGNMFGEEDWITGTLQVVFSYPKERRAEYETNQFSYYVVVIP